MYNIIYIIRCIRFWRGGDSYCARRVVLHARGRSCDVPTGLNGLFLFPAYYGSLSPSRQQWVSYIYIHRYVRVCVYGCERTAGNSFLLKLICMCARKRQTYIYVYTYKCSSLTFPYKPSFV